MKGEENYNLYNCAVEIQILLTKYNESALFVNFYLLSSESALFVNVCRLNRVRIMSAYIIIIIIILTYNQSTSFCCLVVIST